MFISHFVPRFYQLFGMLDDRLRDVFNSLIKFKGVFFLNNNCDLPLAITDDCARNRFHLIKWIAVVFTQSYTKCQILSFHHRNPVTWDALQCCIVCRLWEFLRCEGTAQNHTAGKCQTHSWISVSDFKFRTLFVMY